MSNQDFVHYLLYKVWILTQQFIFLYLVVLLCEWFAGKKGYSIFQRSWLITLVSMPILTLILWTILFNRLKWF